MAHSSRRGREGTQHKRDTNSTDQQVERVLSMGLDKFELWECHLEGFDVVPVLHLVETVCWSFLVTNLAERLAVP
jgi:hypothetical protein